MWNARGRTARRWECLVNNTSFASEVGRPAGLTASRIRRLRQPVLLSYGGASFCLETCRRLEALLEDAVTVIHPGLGHFFPVVEPQLVVRDVREFLGRVRARSDRLRLPVAESPGPRVERAP
jgi:pimeloyl-ACP methyl ester carboxylesterase